MSTAAEKYQVSDGWRVCSLPGSSWSLVVGGGGGDATEVSVREPVESPRRLMTSAWSSRSRSATPASGSIEAYMHAETSLQEKALALTTPTIAKPGRYRPPTTPSPSSTPCNHADTRTATRPGTAWPLRLRATDPVPLGIVAVWA